MEIPFTDLRPLIRKLRHEVISDWDKCLMSGSFLGGEINENFEEQVRVKLEADHFVACASGTDALIIGLESAGVKKGMRIAMPNLTFWATYEAIKKVGANPILVDIDPKNLQMNFEEFVDGYEQFRFHGVVLPHLFGWCSDKLEGFRTFCKVNGIILVEDSAQSFGVRLNSRSIYSGSNISAISFYPTKVIGGIMDGGGIVTKSSKIAQKCAVLRNHGRIDSFAHSHIGWNSRMGNIQAAFLSRAIVFSDEIIAERLAIFNLYKELWEEYLKEYAEFYQPPSKVEGNGYLTVFALTSAISRDMVQKDLKSEGIEINKIYPRTIDMQDPAKNEKRTSALNNSKSFCESVFNLPLYFGIPPDHCQRIVEVLSNCLNRYKRRLYYVG